MKWYRELIAQAGFGSANFALALVLPPMTSLGIGLVAGLAFEVAALALATFFLSLTLQLELLRVRSNRRVALITDAWPEVVESFQSAFQSGLSVSRAFEDLSQFGPARLRASFAYVVGLLDKGHQLSDCLNWLKVELSTEPSDRTIESLRLLDELGGHSANEVLASLANDLRKQVEFESELAAKQGWVVTTAKLGLIAPWAIVLLLSRRPENAAVYNSTTGVIALLGGLGICLLAYLIIQLFGSPLKSKRVFVNVG